MAYHADFWVVAGAAAPVLLVAHVVAATQLIGMIRLPGSFWPTASVLLSLASVVMTGVVLVMSLESLADEANKLSPSAAVVLIAVVVSLTLWQLAAWLMMRLQDPAAYKGEWLTLHRPATRRRRGGGTRPPAE
jgi:hypothetical protein